MFCIPSNDRSLENNISNGESIFHLRILIIKQNLTEPEHAEHKNANTLYTLYTLYGLKSQGLTTYTIALHYKGNGVKQFNMTHDRVVLISP